MLIIAATIMRKGAGGIGTRGLSDTNGVARIDYERMMWISSLKLSQLNAKSGWQKVITTSKKNPVK